LGSLGLSGECWISGRAALLHFHRRLVRKHVHRGNARTFIVTRICCIRQPVRCVSKIIFIFVANKYVCFTQIRVSTRKWLLPSIDCCCLICLSRHSRFRNCRPCTYRLVQTIQTEVIRKSEIISPTERDAPPNTSDLTPFKHSRARSMSSCSDLFLFLSPIFRSSVISLRETGVDNAKKGERTKTAIEVKTVRMMRVKNYRRIRAYVRTPAFDLYRYLFLLACAYLCVP